MAARPRVPRKHQTTVASRIADWVRVRIVRGDLPPGQPLRQADLSRKFGTSRIPLREALRQLEGEGLVTIHPYRGAMAAPLSAEEVRDTCELLIALETRALKLAIPRMTASVLARARAAVEERDARRDIRGWAELNRQFNLILLAPAERPGMLEVIRLIHGRYWRYLHVFLRAKSLRDKMRPANLHLLELCRKGDIEGAVAYHERTISSIGSAFIEHMLSLTDTIPVVAGKRGAKARRTGSARAREGDLTRGSGA